MNVPKPNLSWLYIIIIAALGILYFSSDEGSVKKDVSYTEFKEMVNNNYASKIIAYDDNTVDMFIKPENIGDVFKSDSNKVGRSPSVHVQIGSMEAFDNFITEAQKEQKFTGSVEYQKKNDYFGMIFWNIAPFLLLIAIWILPCDA